MRTLVVYRTRYGSTREYAQWIAEDLAADVMPMSEVRPSDLKPYHVVIVGGFLRIGKIQGADFLTRNWDALSRKHVFLYSVAAAPERAPVREVWYAESVPDHIREQVPHFPVRGRVKDLNWWDRFLMWFPKMMLKRKYQQEPTEENRRALAGMDEFDAVSRATIKPLVEAVRALPR